MAGKGFVKLLIVIVVFAAVLFFLLALTIKPFRVADDTMNPTFSNGQKIVVTMLAYVKSSPKREDIIIVGSDKPMIRRVIGLPGETVEIRKGKVYINDQLLNEPYLGNVQDYDFDQKAGQIDPTHYLVLADNRTTAYYRGTKISTLAWVPKDSILGKYWFSY